MDLTKRLFINVTPGDTFLDKLTGRTKVRLFLAFILLLIATWDMRIILPIFIISLIGLASIRPNWKLMAGLGGFIALTNLFNLLLIFLVEQDYGDSLVGASHVLVHLGSHYALSGETLWYFAVRFLKFMATFLVSITFIQSITPSEIAAGLYALHVPYKVATIVSIAFRYIPEITRDFSDIKISMQARGMELDSRKAGVFKRLKQNIVILVPLIIVSFDRIGNIANAMDLRGYGSGKTRTYYAEHEMTGGDYKMRVVYILLYIGLLAVIVGRIFFPGPHTVWAPWI